MLFRGDEGMKPTKALSGGEAVRLLFCKLMLVKPNVLVLDERPTTSTWSRSPHGGRPLELSRHRHLRPHDRDLIDRWPPASSPSTTAASRTSPAITRTFLERHGGFIDAH